MRYALIGHPAAHSLSPAIHRAGYASHGLDHEYEAVDVPPERLDEFLGVVLGDPAWGGLSVTAPHKEAVLRYGEPDEATRLLGGGNTLVLGEDVTVHNTDAPGFVLAWRRRELPTPTRAAIVGNGATARSVALGLAGLGTRELVVLARAVDRAQNVVELAGTLGMEASAQPLDEPLENVDALVNTVPAEATAPFAAALVSRCAVLFDVVYDPWPTPLGSAAEAAGRVALSGLDLLAGQAVDQFYLLTGERVSFELCRSAAEQELGRRRQDLEG